MRIVLRQPVGALPLDLSRAQFKRTITSDYGWRFHPIYIIPRKHRGVDLGRPRGTPVLSAKAGTVSIGRHKEMGNYVLVKDAKGFKTRRRKDTDRFIVQRRTK